jgi:enoyl-CoA hydratase/carnithine racemase
MPLTAERSHNCSTTLRFVLPLALVAQAAPDELGPDLDPSGVPRRPLLIIDADAACTDAEAERAVANLRGAGAVTVAVGTRVDPAPPLAEVVDLAIARGRQRLPREVVRMADPEAALAHLAARVAASPVASLSLGWLLRSSARSSVRDALVQESALFSALLAGAEFRRWLEQRGRPRAPDGPQRVSLTREQDVLSIVLDRVARRNAVDARMRDALREALEIARLDVSLRVQVAGAGPAFCAGGDLDEFGTATDLALAHLVRVQASPGAVLHAIRDRVTVRVHGACMGAGIEIPAFAARVVAAPDSRFALPEIAMGLIPGAGGTVSITRRIGRHRTLWMALTGDWIDVRTARSWGLVDAVE